MQSVMEFMEFFLILLIFIPISFLTTTTTVSSSDEVIKSSRIKCPIEPYSPISLCAAVPEMDQTTYFKLATKCLDDTYTKARYLREGGKPSEENGQETNEKDGHTGNDDDTGDDNKMVDPWDTCMICLCAHFLDRFSNQQQRAWILQQSWAKSTSDQPVTITPSAPLVEWVEDPHTEVSTKGMPDLGWMNAILVVCGSVGVGVLGMLFKDSLVGQQPTPMMPPDGRHRCSCGKFTKKGSRCLCGRDSKIPRYSKNA